MYLNHCNSVFTQERAIYTHLLSCLFKKKKKKKERNPYAPSSFNSLLLCEQTMHCCIPQRKIIVIYTNLPANQTHPALNRANPVLNWHVPQEISAIRSAIHHSLDSPSPTSFTFPLSDFTRTNVSWAFHDLCFNWDILHYILQS